jgi:hypothetical protein
MTLEEYFLQKRKALADFLANWSEQAQSDPSSYPTEMNLVDWDEQFQFFETLQSLPKPTDDEQ